MRMLVKSFIYFISQIFLKRNYDVVFYSPQHFNRERVKENQYFRHLIKSCKKHNLTYIVFEEPDFRSNFKRNKLGIPFDFIFYLIIILRKFFNSEIPVRSRDSKIGIFLSETFFRRINFKNVITISQSMVSVFRGINNYCTIFDVQHGIIHPNKANYLVNRIPSNNLKENHVHVLFSGEGYQELLISNDSTSFFRDHSFVIGSHINSSRIKHKMFNNNILVTLQFTHDHTDDENNLLLEGLLKIIRSADRGISFYLKHHPRFNNDINLDELLILNNVNIAPVDIKDCFEICSLHLTAYSTCVFEAALMGIPSLIVNPIEKFNYFNRYFTYIKEYVIKDFYNSEFYIKEAKRVQDWAIPYYSSYDENTFIRLLR